MPPIVLPAFLKVVLGAFGAAAALHWAMKEIRRVNDELDRVRAASPAEAGARQALPTLRRDPRTGDWRLR
ncbi:MAG: hypothetical protein QOG83_2800 [Alphaproteobacteria bacterium]|jgi:hypothetical protein|nr:hypothetical protein [Alphaproteobacteria bacterium]MEA2990089.1 hypothetical protein [Alphaproteobacteria bacterium]